MGGGGRRGAGRAADGGPELRGARGAGGPSLDRVPLSAVPPVRRAVRHRRAVVRGLVVRAGPGGPAGSETRAAGGRVSGAPTPSERLPSVSIHPSAIVD